MDLDNSFSVLIYQLGWSLPTCLTVVVIAVVAVVRRDAGLWWKLVVAGAALTLLAQVINVLGTVALVQAGAYQAQWAVSMITVALNVAALALIGSGAVVGRRGAVAR